MEVRARRNWHGVVATELMAAQSAHVEKGGSPVIGFWASWDGKELRVGARIIGGAILDGIRSWLLFFRDKGHALVLIGYN